MLTSLLSFKIQFVFCLPQDLSPISNILGVLLGKEVPHARLVCGVDVVFLLMVAHVCVVQGTRDPAARGAREGRGLVESGHAHVRHAHGSGESLCLPQPC